MKKILFGLALALATPAVAHAAEEPKKACCCDRKGETKPDHDGMQH